MNRSGDRLINKQSSLFLLSLCLFIICTHSLSLQLRSHRQIGTFADVINNSNHVTPQQLSIGPDTETSSNASSTKQTNSSTPKIAAGIIIPIICIGLCFICCFFCLRCAQNQQQQAERDLEETIPCYCGPIKCLGKFCKYLLCFDIILRCLGFKRTNWEKKQELRLKQEQERKKKEQKDKKKYQKQYSNVPVQQSNPYQTQMRREDLEPVTNWKNVENKADSQKVKKDKCGICEGKVKNKSNIIACCQGHCVFHLQCLIGYKNQNSLNKTSNLCPKCNSNYFNMVQFYCQKCGNKYNEVQIESGNVYASQLDSKEVVKSIGGEKCDECAKKKWFWQ